MGLIMNGCHDPEDYKESDSKKRVELIFEEALKRVRQRKEKNNNQS